MEKGRENMKLDQSLKEMDKHISWDGERQQHTRKMLLSKMEQEKTPERKSWLKRKAVPVAATILFFGTAGTLVVSEFSEQAEQTGQGHEQQVNMSENSSGQGFDIGIDEDVEAGIAEIKASGFDLQLPQYAPVEGTKLESFWNRTERQHNTVTASYTDEHGNEVFKFMQEELTENADVSHLQEKADYETEINGNITFVSENDHSGLLTINIIANEYGYTLSTYNLTEAELFRVGESINY